MNDNGAWRPGRGQKIAALYAWIAVDPDGGEGVCGASIGGMMMPLVGADRERLSGQAGAVQPAHRPRGTAVTGDDAPDLGPCCMCETRDGVRNMILLDRCCAVPGHGWGCVVCGLPPDGACAVLCDEWQDDASRLTVACRGWPASDGRIAIAELPAGKFVHDAARHADDSKIGAMLGAFGKES